MDKQEDLTKDEKLAMAEFLYDMNRSWPAVSLETKLELYANLFGLTTRPKPAKAR